MLNCAPGLGALFNGIHIKIIEVATNIDIDLEKDCPV